MDEIAKWIVVLIWVIVACYLAFNKNYTMIFGKKEVHNLAARFLLMLLFWPLLVSAITIAVSFMVLICIAFIALLLLIYSVVRLFI
jgi:hypothetical protein